MASTALHDLLLRPQGKKMLVPLTASLYVPGTLDDAIRSWLMLALDTSLRKQWLKEKNCDRKIKLLKSNFDQLIEIASKKKNLAYESGVILNVKLKQMAPTT